MGLEVVDKNRPLNHNLGHLSPLHEVTQYLFSRSEASGSK